MWMQMLGIENELHFVVNGTYKFYVNKISLLCAKKIVNI